MRTLAQIATTAHVISCESEHRDIATAKQFFTEAIKQRSPSEKITVEVISDDLIELDVYDLPNGVDLEGRREKTALVQITVTVYVEAQRCLISYRQYCLPELRDSDAALAYLRGIKLSFSDLVY